MRNTFARARGLYDRYATWAAHSAALEAAHWAAMLFAFGFIIWVVLDTLRVPAVLD